MPRRSPWWPRPTRQPPGPPGPRSACGRSRCPPVLDLLASEKAFARYEITKGDLEAGLRRGRPGRRRGIPRRPAGAHLHRAAGDDRRPARPAAAITVSRARSSARTTSTPPWPAPSRSRSSKVRVVQAETGGGFGGKEEYPSMLAVHAALLARAAGRPVRMTYDRHEDIAATTKRHPAVVRHRTGVDAGRPAGGPGHRGRHGRRRLRDALAGRPVAGRAPRHAGRIAARTSGSGRARR